MRTTISGWPHQVVAAVCFAVGLGAAGCRSNNSLPDYMPREVIAKRVGDAVAYDMDFSKSNESRAPVGIASAPVTVPSPAPQVPSPATPVAVSPAPVTSPAAPLLPATTAMRRIAYGIPAELSITDKGLRAATITWSVPVDQIYRLRIERSEAPGGPFEKVEEVAPRKLEYTDGGTTASRLKDNTTYYYRMVAILERDGPQSEPSMVLKTTTAPPPVPPPEVQASALGSRAALIKWAEASSEGVTGYRIERAASGASPFFEAIGMVKGLSYTDGGTAASTLKDSAKYLYRVLAINRVGAESAPSAAAEMTTLPPPRPVQKLAAVSDEVRCVPLAWEPSPEPDVIRYDLYRSRATEGPYEKIAAISGRMSVQYLDGETNPGKLEDEGTYCYRIRAVNSVTAESTDSETTRAITRAVPPDVQQANVVPGRPREIPVSWSVAQDQTVVGYELWRSIEGEDDWTQVARLNGRATTNYLDRGGAEETIGLGGLKDGTVYQYKLIAFNTANVRSSASLAASARTKYSPKPPVAVTATTNLPLSIRLNWQPNAEKDISDYVVECSDRPDASFRKLVAVSVAGSNSLSATEMPLESSVTRYYRVKAVDRDGLESVWSQTITGCSKPVPDTPPDLQAQQAGNNVRLTWKSPPQKDIRLYKVWRKKFIGWELVSTTDQTSYLFEFTELAKPMTVAVSALDQDELESEKSRSVEVKLGL